MAKLKFSNALIIFLVIINLLPILAPILQAHGFLFPAKVVYFIYSFFCHQIHWRSLHIFDHQCAWCTRDMAIWGGFLITAVLVKIFMIKGLKWYQIIPFMIPIALDGGVQTIATAVGVGRGDPVYVSTNLMRWITGSIFGIGLGITVIPIVLRMEVDKLQDRVKLWKDKINFHQLWMLPIIFAFMFLLYLGFVQAWKMTSSDYMPSNAIDSAVKLPADPNLWLERRKNGVCTTEISMQESEQNDPLALDCFF